MKVIYLKPSYDYEVSPELKAEDISELDYDGLTRLLQEIYYNISGNSRRFKKAEKDSLVDQLVMIAGDLGRTLLDSKEIKFLQNYKTASAVIQIPVGYGGPIYVNNAKLTSCNLEEIYHSYSSPDEVRCDLSVELPSYLKEQIEEYYAKKDKEKKAKLEKKKQKKIEAAKKLLEKSGVKVE